MTRDAIIHYTAMDRLRDKRKVKIRTIRPADKSLVIDALQRVSPESLYYRLFAPKKVFTDEDLKPFIEVDPVNVVALVAVLEEGENQKIVGGGRYVRCGPSETGQRAEVAFLIDDAHQGLGIGSRIFKHLTGIALASGITAFEAEVLPSNDKMLRVFDRGGFPVSKTRTRDSIHVNIDLTSKGGQERSSAGPIHPDASGEKP